MTYECTICNKIYKSPQSLWNHKNKYHQTQELEEKKYSCSKCGKSFNYPQSKWRHETKSCNPKLNLLENEIDKMNESLPAMKHFILPGGHPAVSTTHVARCVCRRAERLCVNMQEHDLFVDPLVIKYINRLSDYLFVLSRYISHQLGVVEVEWKPRIN